MFLVVVLPFFPLVLVFTYWIDKFRATALLVRVEFPILLFDPAWKVWPTVLEAVGSIQTVVASVQEFVIGFLILPEFPSLIPY